VSKLIDMLRKGQGDIAEALSPLVDAGLEHPPSGHSEFRSEGASAPSPEPAPPPIIEVPPAAPLPEVSSAPRIRRLSLRLPAPSPLLPFETGKWASSEQYRILRTKISQHPRQPALIVITSPGPGDGKSVSSINTAAALALKSEGQVLLVDADLRKSAIHVQLGIPDSPGLADVLAGSCALEEALIHTNQFANLYVMPSGKAPANPAELLDSARWRSLCAELRGMFRYVIIDSPPVNGIADYELIQAVCDGVVLVLRPDFTKRDLCLNALQVMPEAKFLGVLLNWIPDWWFGRHAGSGYDYYSNGESSRRSPEC
jgi:capsular exopolysaccharide synthesis family protein